MRFPSIKRIAIAALAGAIAVLTLPGVSRASLTVLPGWDLFQTTPPTTFAGVAFSGVPLGTFDFGPGFGVLPTGTTDTIVQRLGTASVPGPVPMTAAPVPIEMVALQLVSTAPTAVFGPLDTYYITLQSVRGGPASTGTITITFGPEGIPHGTFDSTIAVAFDVRQGSLAGPIVLSDTLPLTATAVPWSHFPPAGATEITGVNVLLNGQNRDNDFWPLQAFAEVHPSAPPGLHTVQPGIGPDFNPNIPEPGSVVLFGTGALGLLGSMWRRRKRA